mmetsp:Transcript_6169/g.17225  ORF Transcript_6169/g.17225 Transcript_6169/m.17225 type:complete len:627 (+) Transcript_6169:94-1974(+)
MAPRDGDVPWGVPSIEAASCLHRRESEAGAADPLDDSAELALLLEGGDHRHDTPSDAFKVRKSDSFDKKDRPSHPHCKASATILRAVKSVKKPRWTRAQVVLLRATILAFIFMIIEFVGGYVSQSVAIASDAAHMFSDVSGYIIALAAAYLSSRGATRKYPYGYKRVEVLGALMSVVLIWVVTLWLVLEAVERLVKPQEVNHAVMVSTAAMGIVFNVCIFCVLGAQHHHHYGMPCTGHHDDSKTDGRGHRHGHSDQSHSSPHHHGHDSDLEAGHQCCHQHQQGEAELSLVTDGHHHAAAAEGPTHELCPHDHSHANCSHHSTAHTHCSHHSKAHAHSHSSCSHHSHAHAHTHHTEEHESHGHGHHDCHSHSEEGPCCHGDADGHEHGGAEGHCGHGHSHHPGDHKHAAADEHSGCHGHEHSHGHETGGHHCSHGNGHSHVSRSEEDHGGHGCDHGHEIHGSGYGHGCGHDHGHEGHGCGHDHENLNVRGAVLHALGDLLQSIGVLIAGLVMWAVPSWWWADPIATLFFSIVVFWTTRPLILDIFAILMQRAPVAVCADTLESELLAVPGALRVESLSVWSLSSDHHVMSAHISVAPGHGAEAVLRAMEAVCRQHRIWDTTIQVELE